MQTSFSKTSLKTLLLSGLAVGAIAVTNAHAQTETFTGAQKTEIETIMKDYLMENPEIITEAMMALRVKQETEAQEQAKAKIVEYQSDFKSDTFPFAGNKDGDVIVVEFFDYNCGYCKKALPDVQALVSQDKNVKVVFMDMPILGPTSLTTSKWALAAQEQGKYFEYHAALMEHLGGKEESDLAEIAKVVGLDVEKMKKDANSDKVQNKINESMKIAQDIGIQGTPAFIVGDKLYRGYIGEAALIKSVEDSRG